MWCVYFHSFFTYDLTADRNSLFFLNCSLQLSVSITLSISFLHHDCHHDCHHHSQQDGRFHRLGQWHCSVRLGIGASPCLSLFAFMMNKASSNRNCTSYIHPKLQKQQEIITSLKPNDWSEN